MLGYVLMGILVAIGTMTILYLAYGYDIDRKTGTLIQNGIVFVDSKPQGARIFVNDKEHRSRTDARMVLPSGVYTIRLERDGYRTWERTFNLEGGQIQRLVYPFLLPNQLVTTDVAQFDALPALATQSPDRRWVLVQVPGQTYQFQVFDLNSPDRQPASIVVPPAALTNPGAIASLRVIEWSNNNRHVMFERTFDETSEFLVLDREQPAETVNLNTAFGIAPQVVSLKNKRHDQFYYLDSTPGLLRAANLGNRTISAPLADAVIDYATYGDDIVMYATQQDVSADKADIRILEGDKTYVLKTVTAAPRYVMDVSRYDNKWFYVAGSSADTVVSVYENPLATLKHQGAGSPQVFALIRLDSPQFVSFSANTQFIGLQSGNRIITLDLEHGNQYRIELAQDIALTDKIRWMDGHRYIFTAMDQSYIVDFDGSNENTLVTSRLHSGPFFDRDYDNVFTFEESKTDGNKKALTQTVIDD